MVSLRSVFARKSDPRLAIAERFRCDVASLAGIELPLGSRPQEAGQIDLLIRDTASGANRRASWSLRESSLGDSVPISFTPMPVEPGTILDLAVAFDADEHSSRSLWEAFDKLNGTGRDPISIPCLSERTAIEEPVIARRFWCDKNGLFVEGEIARSSSSVEDARLVCGEDSAGLDIEPLGEDRSRFTGYLSWRAGTPVWITWRCAGETILLPLTLPRGDLEPTPWGGRDQWDETMTEAMAAEGGEESQAAISFKHFVRMADDPKMTVVEVGGRVVGDASQAMRRYMPKAGRFLSVDIHASDHVDVVGDAHYLDDLIGAESVDAIFSLSVMEHLAYPWLFAAAVNRALKPGGLVFQSTPHTWPLHETPNDFWRFSDEALKILFGPETGFEIINAGMVNRIWLYPEERRGAFVDMPFNHGYGNAYIYARKVRHLETDLIRWPVDRSASDSLARKYPEADRASRGAASGPAKSEA
ncbi:methyltransferase domain-containing protein [Fulvimarina endophytica]|uniref:Methyltransferase domain-containing protein n=1 Tax=Fulvimarina endophytica TaxID=2293836 RepID=A0A371WYW0_9HYPH|nr:methyltransferase domain-containing protein [Fulvimarina endophytica]RFC62162.1 methyltransferase domain-containing protein [Fulvimarina endophytica]